MSEPQCVIPMSTTETLPEGLPEGHAINRTTILTSRGHNTPGEARDGLAEWAQKCSYDAVIGVRMIAVAEVVHHGEHTTELKWAAYGTAIGW
jgi:uncharacterized protein YbjQ (UPF0145 family)